MSSGPCIVCGGPEVEAKDRCPTCNRYRQRHGVDRPVELIIRQTERDIARELERRRTS